MNIKNKYSHKQKVFIGDSEFIIYKICIDSNNEIEYQVWDFKTNTYSRYDEWQLSDKKEVVGFN